MRPLSTCQETPEARVTVFLSTHTEDVPPALQLKHNKVLYQIFTIREVGTDRNLRNV
jgi:hypothetical protein